jgi:hypothetical protein
MEGVTVNIFLLITINNRDTNLKSIFKYLNKPQKNLQDHEKIQTFQTELHEFGNFWFSIL